jgi:hypothetical protein
MSRTPLKKHLRKFVGLNRKYFLSAKLFLSLKPDKQYYAFDIDTTITSAAVIGVLEMFLTSKEKSRK